MLNQEQKDFVKSGIELLWLCACKGQTKPDGDNCAICSDNDHQAFECLHNIGLQVLEIGEVYFHD